MTRYILILIISWLHISAFAQTDALVKDSVRITDTIKSTSSASSKKAKRSAFILPTADLRGVDGVLLGLTLQPRGINDSVTTNKLTVLKSIRTKALKLEINSEWQSEKRSIGLDGVIDLAGNLMNFFGRGNETTFDQTGEFRKFYRVNLSLIQIEPFMRFQTSGNTSWTIGPSFQYASFSRENNEGRFILNGARLNTGEFLEEDKAHLGFKAGFGLDTRKDLLFPANGINLGLKAAAYRGMNEFSENYAQVFPFFSIFKSLNKSGSVVLANRIGGAAVFGRPAFYQNAFLGSQDNLLGFRKFRFAGDALVYNNLEARILIKGFWNRIIGGRIALVGFYDVGRVYVKDEDSSALHHGYGLGVLMSPQEKIFVRVNAGFSEEGLQPVLSLNQRF